MERLYQSEIVISVDGDVVKITLQSKSDVAIKEMLRCLIKECDN